MSSTAAEQPAAPERNSNDHEKFERLLQSARALPKLSVAVAHPCDQASLGAVLEAATIGIIEPTLVGPLHKILACAESLKADISKFHMVEAAPAMTPLRRPWSGSGPDMPRRS